MVLTVADNVGTFRVQAISIYDNICKNMWKIAENWNMVLIVGRMLGNMFRVQSTLPNLIIYPKLARKLEGRLQIKHRVHSESRKSHLV